MEPAQLPWSQARFCAAVASAADSASRTAELVTLLQEEHPAYAQCSAAEVSRRRGWVLIELGNTALESGAVPLVLEELETGHIPYLLAAAARALRQADTPMPAYAPALLRTIEALVRRDDLVDLSCWGGTAQSGTQGSGLDEALKTLRWLGQHAWAIRDGLSRLLAGPTVLADEHCVALHEVLQLLPENSGAAAGANCCDVPLPWRRHVPLSSLASIHEVRFENQDGVPVSWDEFFIGQPTIVAFFYTRCDNELKCSLTITKVAQVQRLLRTAGLENKVRIAAITYDPDFDLPRRLRGYAESRGLIPGPQCGILRTSHGRQALRSYFTSGVNFVGSLVNRHRIEVFVLDAEGRIIAAHQRLSWAPHEVVADAKADPRETARLSASTVWPVHTTARAAPVLWASALALLPKCPICGATYLSLSGLAALPYLPGWVSAWPVVALLLLLNLGALAWIARGKRNWAPLAWSSAGAASILGPGLALGYDVAIWVGLVGTAIGSVLAVKGASTRRALLKASGRADMGNPVSRVHATKHS